MSDTPEEVKNKMKKDPIWMCAEVWFGIFPSLPPRQLGIEFAQVNRRFECLVDGHLKTRQWALGNLRIRHQIDTDGTKAMEIVKQGKKTPRKALPIMDEHTQLPHKIALMPQDNSTWTVLPIPNENIPLPDMIIGFECIDLYYIDRTVIAFLHRIRRLFGEYAIIFRIGIGGKKDCVAECILRNIWPFIGGNICGMELFDDYFCSLRRHSPTLLSDCCPELKSIIFHCTFPEFPADDSANATIGQAMAKWLCTPRADGQPKVLKCGALLKEGHLDAMKREFANASSRVNFIIFCWPAGFDSFIPAPFELINQLTGERLALKRSDDDDDFDSLFVRGPISRDEKQWAKWEDEAIDWDVHDQWSRFGVFVDHNHIDEDLLDDATAAGPSDQQQSSE